MKAAVLKETGKLVVTEVDDPVPGENEVLVRIECCGICGTDIKLFKGEYSVETPVIPGHEFSGAVVDTGRKVSLLRSGDRVVADPNYTCGSCGWCREGKTNFCDNAIAYGVTKDGGFAEYVCMPASSLHRLPEETDHRCASFAEPLSCAIHAIEKSGISQGDSVGIMGGGPQGQMLVQLAKLEDAERIIMITRSKEKLDMAGTLGATHLVESGRTSSEDVMDITGGLGLDVVVEAVGIPETFETALTLVKRGGKIIVFGLNPDDKKSEIHPFDLTTKEITIAGSWLNPSGTFKRAVNLLAQKKIEVSPLISDTVVLDKILDGFTLMMERPREFMKAVVMMKGQ